MSVEEVDPVPPSAGRVAQRALVLTAVVCRSEIEGDAGVAAAERFHQSVIEWVERVGLLAEMEPEELVLVRTPLGKLSERQRLDAGWRAEGLAVLGWALGRYELPPYDMQAEGRAVSLALGFRGEQAHTVLASPKVRPRDELSALSARLFTLHWRLRQFSLDKATIDFPAVARRAWFGPLRIDGLRLREGDLDLRGVPVSRAPEAVWREVLSIARERRQAANWLEGENPAYSRVTCDT